MKIQLESYSTPRNVLHVLCEKQPGFHVWYRKSYVSDVVQTQIMVRDTVRTRLLRTLITRRSVNRVDFVQ